MLGGLVAAGDAGLHIDLVVVPAAAALHEGHGGLELGQVVVGVHDDLLAAGHGAGGAAHALLIVDHGMVVDDRNGLLGAGLSTVAAAHAAIAAELIGPLFLVLVVAGHEVAGVLGDHSDKLLRAGLGAGAAAVAGVLAHLDGAVHDGQGLEGTSLHAGAGADAAELALVGGEAGLHSLIAGGVDLQTGLARGAAAATHKSGQRLGLHRVPA